MSTTGTPTLVTYREIASLFDVAPRLPRSWAERRATGNGFPAPVQWIDGTPPSPLFDRDQIVQWWSLRANGTHRPPASPRDPLPLTDRFWPKVQVGDPEACWPWLASIKDNGYGQIRTSDGQVRRAHVVAWEMTTGHPVPAGHELDHTCHNRDLGCPGGHTCTHRSCVNPGHLEPVPHRVNVIRGRVSNRG